MAVTWRQERSISCGRAAAASFRTSAFRQTFAACHPDLEPVGKVLCAYLFADIFAQVIKVVEYYAAFRMQLQFIMAGQFCKQMNKYKEILYKLHK